MHLPTLYFCLVTLLSIKALAFTLLHRSERKLISTEWMALAFASFAVGLALVAARDYLGELPSILGGNAIAFAGYLFLHRSVMEFLGQGRRDQRTGLLVFAVMMGGILWFTLVTPHIGARILFFSVAIVFQVGLTARRLFMAGDLVETRVGARFMAAVLGGVAVVYLARAVQVIWTGAPATLMTGGTMEAVILMALLVSLAGVTFGFIWLTSARLHSQLRDQAHRDPLTGLLNRRGFLAQASRRLKGNAEKGQLSLLLFADLDGLKQVNDSAGHDAGDRALMGAADILREELRKSDSIARLGGDEFCALIPVSKAGDGELILQRLEQRVQSLGFEMGAQSELGMSAALVEVDPHNPTPIDELLKRADARMYATKRARKSSATSTCGGDRGLALQEEMVAEQGLSP